MTIKHKIQQHLKNIYTGKKFDEANELFQGLLQEYTKEEFKETSRLTQENVYLITYGDSFVDGEKAPLQVLNEVVAEKLADTVTDIHLLPMFPYTSDDGFSVKDYMEINSDLGTWDDIEKLAKQKRLMFDFVANHMSKSSEWFQKFLARDPEFAESFIMYDENFDASNVTRPRTSPLFHAYQNTSGEIIKAWSTFSEDQVDLNVQDPKTLVRLTQVLLEYAKRGAASIRLDAIGFLWKESGTTSMHLRQTHEIIQLWRDLLEEFAPNTQIITETNVPHEDNISYFGDGSNEAHQVYQFPLPPLVLYSFLSKNAEKLSQWASGIKHVSDSATYFNFLASHDGIGLRPTEGILTDDERNQLVERVMENGGRISYKNNPDGSQSVYEMNINYSEALKETGQTEIETVQKMIAAHHILLSVLGVPAIYYHSFFGSKNDQQGVEQSGINRRINRKKLDQTVLQKELQRDGYRQGIYEGIQNLIRIRKNEVAFDPYGEQEVLALDKRVFALKRTGEETIISLTNVSDEEVEIENIPGYELISGQPVKSSITLAPYQIAWIKKETN